MIISFTGPSGVGKGFLKSKLLEFYPSIEELPWATTRMPRQGESGRICVNRVEFARMQSDCALILDQELYGELYGLVVSNIDQARDYVTELHIGNIDRIGQYDWSFYSIAVLPDSLEFLEARLRNYRCTEDELQIERRLNAASSEMAAIERHVNSFNCVLRVSRENETEVAAEMLKHLDILLKGAAR